MHRKPEDVEIGIKESVGSHQARRIRLAIDIGGTFTDAVLVEEGTGAITIDKVLTTPADPSEGFLQCIQRLQNRVGFEPAQIVYIVHGTTVATNTVLERRGARTAMLVTQGYRDVLEIGRQIRHELYNLQTDKLQPIVPRERCIEIPERIDYLGDVILPLDEALILDAIQSLRKQKVDSIAVCFLHSYRNPTHEQRAGELIRQYYPEARVSLSSGIAPEIREYWRASTAAMNAYIAPVVAKYLAAIEEKLTHYGVETKMHIMQSSGGIMTAAAGKENPIYLLESGPAAGVIAASHFAGIVGRKNAISFDMGGTTAKMGLILNGEPKVVPEFEAGGISGSGTGISMASGYPILASVVDLVEVGAGGGSMAWVDAGGLMHVGPRSAGADPGPVCYGRGGSKPTVTDANLVLGRLNPEYFLGGEIKLNMSSAQKAIDIHCAEPLGISTIDAAMGIIDIANTTMGEAMRLVSVQRGLDPREFILFASGGAGPAHANQIADELSIPLVIVPPSPGTASALGMLVSNMRREYRLTRIQLLDNVRIEDLSTIYHDFEAKAFHAFTTEGLDRDLITLERYVEMRYVCQSWKLKVEVPKGELNTGHIAKLKEAFHIQHEQLYGYSVLEESVEIVNVGLLAVGFITKPGLKQIPIGGHSAESAQKGIRPVYFRKHGFVNCPIFNRYALYHGNVIMGPAVIEEIDSTTIVHPGYEAEVGPYGILLLQKPR